MKLLRMAVISGASIATGAVVASSVGGDVQFAGLVASGAWVGLHVLVRL